MRVLLPADPLLPRSPDPHFAREAEAARALEVDVVLLDHDALGQGRAQEATARISAGDPIIYRGWMVSAAEYAELERAVQARGSELITSSAQFKRAHELPGWYATLAEHTSRTLWTEGPSLEAAAATAVQLGSGSAVLRDYSKSMKHYWDEACFVPDVTDSAAVSRVCERFLELREDAFTGGLVFRAFETYVGSEARTWWWRGRRTLTTSHPDTPEELPEGLDELPDLGPQLAQLGLDFVTVDFAKRSDGQWRVIEVGDGQVSDLPSSVEPRQLLEPLLRDAI